jgi:long-chain acyl-CoA synthetase
LKPEFLLSVPRVLNRIYHGAMLAGDLPNFRGALFRKAVAVKLERLHTTGINTHPFWDRLVFRKVGFNAIFSGKLSYVSTWVPGSSCARW